MFHLLLFFIGLALLIAGGESLVRGATALAGRLGVAPVLVGMTVVAFGTSTPELVVNLLSAVRGDGSIGFGNIVGSNIANIGLLLGLTAVVRPLIIHRSIVTREIPMMLLAAITAVVLGLDSLIEGGADRFARGDGLVLLLLFGVFLYYTLGDARQQQGDQAAPQEADSRKAVSGLISIAVRVVGGLLLLVAGGELTVRGALGFAVAVGIPSMIVGLTLVAVGTSLPELATTLIASLRGQTDLAMGNIVGSCIFNILFVWGLTVTLAPVDLPEGGWIDLLVMAAFAATLLPLAVSQRKLSRLEGALLATGYAAYIVWLAMR